MRPNTAVKSAAEAQRPKDGGEGADFTDSADLAHHQLCINAPGLAERGLEINTLATPVWQLASLAKRYCLKLGP